MDNFDLTNILAIKDVMRTEQAIESQKLTIKRLVASNLDGNCSPG
jgi:hypothetical protein